MSTDTNMVAQINRIELVSCSSSRLVVTYVVLAMLVSKTFGSFL